MIRKAKRITLFLIFGTLSILFLSVPVLASSFDIQIDYTGDASYAGFFDLAETYWEQTLHSYSTTGTLTGILITADVVSIDGEGGILGQAGPTWGMWQQGYVYATDGIMQFDSDDISSIVDILEDVILHEMAHVIGFGTLWEHNGVYTDGSGEYTGSFALAAYQSEFNQPGATFVPVELGGGAGTADGHWNEVNGGVPLTGIVDSNGQDMRDELMTGWIGGPTFVSNTTMMSFRDIGYTVVPIPSAILLLGSGLIGLLGFRRKFRKG